MQYRNPLLVAAVGGLLGASASAQNVFHVSGAATAGDTAGDLFLDSVEYAGGGQALNGSSVNASDLIYTSQVSGFSWDGGLEKIRVVSGANTAGTSGFHRLEDQDGDSSSVSQADQDPFNARIQAAFGHANLNNLFDQLDHDKNWAFVIEFERELVDDEAGDDSHGELILFERNCDGEFYLQPIDDNGNMIGSGHTVRTNQYVPLTPNTDIDTYDAHGAVSGHEPLGAVDLDLSQYFGVTSARRFILCNTTDEKRASDFKLIGVDTVAQDCDGNGINDLVDLANGAFDADQNGIPDVCEPGVWVYCTGDGQAGGSLDCPCGNNVAPGATEGCANSTGAGASLTASGTPSIAAADLVLNAAGFQPNSPGVFFSGDAAAAGGSGAPFLSGLRCVGGNIVRLSKIPSSPGGQASIPAQGFPPLFQMIGAQPGQTSYFQFWYRDPQGPCGHSANMSNGLRVVWGL